MLRLELPDAVLSLLLDRLSTVEYRLSHGASEKLQLGALVGAFVVGRHMMTPPSSASAAAAAVKP